MFMETKQPATPLSIIAKANDMVFESLFGTNPGSWEWCQGCETQHMSRDYTEINGGHKAYCQEALADAKSHGVVAKCEWCDKLWETEEMSIKGNEYDGDRICPECK
jgi:hypothetical protein